MDPKLGILYFLPTAKIAESPDLKFKGYVSSGSESFAIKNISDLAAELSDQHLDVGKTMGIRRAILDTVEVQKSGQQVHFVDVENGNVESAGGAFASWLTHTSQGPTDADYIAVAALSLSLDPPFTKTEFTNEKEYVHGQFLLLNVNYKSPIAQTPSGNIRWSFGSQIQREAAGVFSDADIGKVAKQTDEQSWWVLERTEPVLNSTNVKPIWGSQDEQSQITAGCFTNRIALFFMADGTDDPFYAFIDEFKNSRVGGNPPRDPADQRALYDIFGDDAQTGWLVNAHQFNHVAAEDPEVIPKLFEASWHRRPYFGDLGLFDDFDALTAASASFLRRDVGRRAYYVDETDELPYSVTLQSVDPVVFSSRIPGSYPIVVRPTPFTDHPFTYHQFPDGDPPNNYGGAGNPDIQGAFRVRDAVIQARVFVTEFKNTD